MAKTETTIPPLPDVVDSIATTGLTMSKTFTLEEVEKIVTDECERCWRAINRDAKGDLTNLVETQMSYVREQDRVRMVCERILRAQHRWIPIAEGLPEWIKTQRFQWVALKDDESKRTDVGVLDTEESDVTLDNGSICPLRGWSHFCLLPDPPEVQE